ncbi:hypothetical protein CALVIDRAFT_542388 [Calocera viscosa TUFC12733]|uniref:F-box domain-containing protein n=1 Tax=Calocera viscosa (strain TUFC12733) TaxID=1330018 RepID=A0A167GNF5_CALVF|nr:hypothetical protein CALVIDRAFT_542388 [Calocera viscosa TUFC12733]
MKRPAPASPPPAKRAHTSSSRSSGSQEHQQHQHQRATISHLSDELFLHILQQLDYESLAIAQRVSSHWLRLARDNQVRSSLPSHPAS